MKGHHVETKQLSQKEQRDNSRKERQFAEGDRVLVNNFSLRLKGKKAHNESRTGPLPYTVRCEDGVVTRRHVDHLLKPHGVTTIDNDDLPDSAVHADQIWFHPQRRKKKRARPLNKFALTQRSQTEDLAQNPQCLHQR